MGNNKSRFIIITICMAVAVFMWWRVPQEMIFTGETMGTTYTIKAYGPKSLSASSIEHEVIQRLQGINNSMSTYIEGSEISRFNRHDSTSSFAVSEDVMTVLTTAERVYRASNGVWDPTVKPLVDLWGFSETKNNPKIDMPSAQEIFRILTGRVGFNEITLKEGRIKKYKGDVTLDLSSIAKGYGVDKVAELLDMHGVTHYMVEIGGEIRVKGGHPSGNEWRLGINTPDPSAEPTDVYKTIKLSDGALATSGEYRQFFEVGSTRYSHILNAKTGYPIEHQTVSVSVIADNCMLADALATALLSVGSVGAASIIAAFPDIQVLMLDWDGSNLTEISIP